MMPEKTLLLDCARLTAVLADLRNAAMTVSEMTLGMPLDERQRTVIRDLHSAIAQSQALLEELERPH
jgi:hypothetical protein